MVKYTHSPSVSHIHKQLFIQGEILGNAKIPPTPPQPFQEKKKEALSH